MLGGRKYGAIYADPPWSFRTYSAKGTGRGAVSHYDCMTLDDLKALPIGDLAADDCALFLWVTDPMLPEAMDVIRAWGFTYKTVAFYWAKLNAKSPGYFTGLGYWTRANPEQCWLATRGKPKRQARDVQRLIVEPRREHSRKPDCARERIERLVPGPYNCSPVRVPPAGIRTMLVLGGLTLAPQLAGATGDCAKDRHVEEEITTASAENPGPATVWWTGEGLGSGYLI